MKVLKFYIKYFIINFIIFDVAVCVPHWYTSNAGVKYLIDSETKLSWYQALNACAERDLYLVAIDTEEKNIDLVQLLKTESVRSRNIWIGAHDDGSKSRDKSRPFYWTTTGRHFEFYYWDRSNPDNKDSREHCVQIWSKSTEYRWNDNLCDTNDPEEMGGFICEQKPFTNICAEVVNEAMLELTCEL